MDMSEEKKILVNGRPVNQEEFIKIQEDVNNDPNKKLKEISPGVYKILEKLED